MTDAAATVLKSTAEKTLETHFMPVCSLGISLFKCGNIEKRKQEY